MTPDDATLLIEALKGEVAQLRERMHDFGRKRHAQIKALWAERDALKAENEQLRSGHTYQVLLVENERLRNIVSGWEAHDKTQTAEIERLKGFLPTPDSVAAELRAERDRLRAQLEQLLEAAEEHERTRDRMSQLRTAIFAARKLIPPRKSPEPKST